MGYRGYENIQCLSFFRCGGIPPTSRLWSDMPLSESAQNKERMSKDDTLGFRSLCTIAGGIAARRRDEPQVQVKTEVGGHVASLWFGWD